MSTTLTTEQGKKLLVIDGKVINVPSTKDTIGCAHKYYAVKNSIKNGQEVTQIITGYELPEFSVPKLSQPLIQYIPTLNDKFRSIGVVPEKAITEDYLRASHKLTEAEISNVVYEVQVSSLKKCIPVKSHIEKGNVEKIIEETEKKFLNVNSIFRERTEDITYMVTAMTQTRNIEIPRKIYKKHTIYDKELNKSTICY